MMEELILRVLRGEASEMERRRLRHWCEADPANQRHFEDIASVWRATARADHVAPILAPEPAHIVERAAGRRREAGRPWRLRLAAAATALLVVGASLAAWRATRHGPAQPASEFVAGAERQTAVTLSDGSYVRLAPGSRLRLRGWRDDRRVVELEGRAFFAVAHDDDHPFAVRTAAGETRVLGTRFELSTRRRDLRLIVVEGRVALSTPGGQVEVHAGQVSRVHDGSAPSVTSVDDVHALLDWPGGLLVFQATPLAEVAREIGRRFGRRVTVTDSSLSQRTVTAWFTDESLEEVVGAVCAIAAAGCTITDSLVTVSP